MGGRDKAWLPLGQNTMVGALIHRIQPLFQDTFVVAQDERPYADLPVTVIHDQYPGLGPISGIHAGLKASRDHYNFVLACDLPLMRVEMVRFLMERAMSMELYASKKFSNENAQPTECVDRPIELWIPSLGGSCEPVAAVYAQEVQEVLEKMILAHDYRLLNILPVLQVEYVREEELRLVDPALESFFNVNTPVQYEQVQEILRKKEEQ